MDTQQHFFDFAAEVGLTKHLGGPGATDEILALCQLQRGQAVLDVGCGAGTTACYIAATFNCKVFGVDILPLMVERSRERAVQKGLTDKVTFRTADAQSLPFEDNSFDVVITESVTAFPEDKQAAVNEYVRVTKPGGYIGLNESTWLKIPPPPDMLTWVSQDVGATVMPLSVDEWRALLETAGLENILTRAGVVDPKEETRALVKRYGLGGMLKSMGRGLRLYLRNPAYRAFVKEVQKGGVIPDNLNEYFGFGIYVGRKPAG